MTIPTPEPRRFRTAKFFILSGPSGAGKSTSAHALTGNEASPHTKEIKNLGEYYTHCTTRSRRPKLEQEGKHYNFKCRRWAETEIANGGVFISTEFVGNYYVYPLAFQKWLQNNLFKKQRNVIIDTLQPIPEWRERLQGIDNLTDRLITIFLYTSKARLEERVRKRLSPATGHLTLKQEQDLSRRMRVAGVRMTEVAYNDYIVYLEDLDELIRTIGSIIIKETGDPNLRYYECACQEAEEFEKGASFSLADVEAKYGERIGPWKPRQQNGRHSWIDDVDSNARCL